MRNTGVKATLIALAMLSLSAATTEAQQTPAGIAGVVRDTTGGVLPGVTVEATSPALIEGVRVVVTDAQGRFNIVDLRAGTYAVTFTLVGFTSFRSEEIVLRSGFTATVNAGMMVGTIQETVTVVSQSPVVDVENTQRKQVFDTEVLQALPSAAKDYSSLAGLILGATPSRPGRNDVGGSLTENATGIVLHGGRSADGAREL